jgi:hypothetical protein
MEVKMRFSKLNIRMWFTKEWYKYVFASKSPDFNWFEVIKCRIQGHRPGVIWYHSTGLEPNMTCKGCGDNLD